MKVNPKITKYIEENILTKYSKNNYGGHGKDHILEVIKRSFEIIDEFNLDVNHDIIYVVAAYHDIGYQENPDEHESVSSQLFLDDENIKNFFNAEEIQIISEAIVDHRASLEYEARSIYGKIVSSADRETSVERMLLRSLLYQTERHASKTTTINDIIEASYKKLSRKKKKNGYAKMYYPDQKYKDYLTEMQELLNNKEKFHERELNLSQKHQKEIDAIFQKVLA